jgi:AraC-like DNA-binding protein
LHVRPGDAIVETVMSDELSLALDGVRIDRVLAATVEVAEAVAADRRFPDRVSDTLGVCLKLGAEHDVRADGRSFTYPRDAVCVRTPGCVWATRSTGAVGFLSLDIEPAALPEAGVSGGMRFVRPNELPDLRRIVEILRGNAEALEKEASVAELVAILIERGFVASADLGAPAPPSAVKRARDFVLASVAAAPTLDELSKAVGANRFVLLRQFRRAFGVPPHAFLLRTRVERSRSLLARGVDVAEVAQVLGFADQSHFTRAFKSIVGLTPGAYRRTTRTSVARP